MRPEFGPTCVQFRIGSYIAVCIQQGTASLNHFSILNENKMTPDIFRERHGVKWSRILKTLEIFSYSDRHCWESMYAPSHKGFAVVGGGIGFYAQKPSTCWLCGCVLNHGRKYVTCTPWVISSPFTTVSRTQSSNQSSRLFFFPLHICNCNCSSLILLGIY